jgi:pilus assembly protein Flp/PilA
MFAGCRYCGGELGTIGTGVGLLSYFVSAGLFTCRWNTIPSRGGSIQMLNWVLVRMFNRARGQGMLEYALIIALVAVVVIASLVLLGPQIANIFKQVNNNL